MSTIAESSESKYHKALRGNFESVSSSFDLIAFALFEAAANQFYNSNVDLISFRNHIKSHGTFQDVIFTKLEQIIYIKFVIVFDDLLMIHALSSSSKTVTLNINPNEFNVIGQSMDAEVTDTSKTESLKLIAIILRIETTIFGSLSQNYYQQPHITAVSDLIRLNILSNLGVRIELKLLLYFAKRLILVR